MKPCSGKGLDCLLHLFSGHKISLERTGLLKVGIPISSPDFQLQMHTPQCQSLLHFPVCYLVDAIPRSTVKGLLSVYRGGGMGMDSVFMNMRVCV